MKKKIEIVIQGHSCRYTQYKNSNLLKQESFRISHFDQNGSLTADSHRIKLEVPRDRNKELEPLLFQSIICNIA